MRKAITCCLLLTAVITVGCSHPQTSRGLAPAKPPPASKPLTEEQLKTAINQLLKQLASDDYRERQDAKEGLHCLLKEQWEERKTLLKHLKEQLKQAEDLDVRDHLERFVTHYSAWDSVLSFQGKDLSKLGKTDSEEFFRILTVLGVEDDRITGKPWALFSLLNDQGKKRYTLIYIIPLVIIPGASCASVCVFDDLGHLLSVISFSTGWRIDIVSVEKFKEKNTGTEMVLIRTDPSLDSGEIYKQYYALAGNDIVLIRLEDSDGSLVRNDYNIPHFLIGPDLPANSAPKLVDSVLKGTWVEKLAILTWLGGCHDDPACEDLEPEVKKDALLTDKVLENKRLIKHINLLCKSQDRWVSKTAKFVLKSLKEDK